MTNEEQVRKEFEEIESLPRDEFLHTLAGTVEAYFESKRPHDMADADSQGCDIMVGYDTAGLGADLFHDYLWFHGLAQQCANDISRYVTKLHRGSVRMEVATDSKGTDHITLNYKCNHDADKSVVHAHTH